MKASVEGGHAASFCGEPDGLCLLMDGAGRFRRPRDPVVAGYAAVETTGAAWPFRAFGVIGQSDIDCPSNSGLARQRDPIHTLFSDKGESELVWRNKEFSVATRSGLRKVDGLTRRGVAIVRVYDSADDVDYFSVTHVKTGARIARLFCSEDRAPTIADKIVALQDWTKVRGSDDVLSATREALNGLSKQHHLIV